MKLQRIDLKTFRNSDHPWIFHKMVFWPRERLLPGTWVEIFSKEMKFVGKGIANPNSEIGIRVITENEYEQINKEFFRRRIGAAIDLRKNILKIEEISDSYRICHSEADGLSGLIIDKLGNVIVVELLSAGYLSVIDLILDALYEFYPNTQIGVVADGRTQKREGADFSSLSKYALPKEAVVLENGIKYHVDFASGHKTGFFLDQRENRKFISKLSNNKKVLDLCCYTGGFSLSAAKGGAQSVTGVDLDEKALEIAKKNAKENKLNVDFKHVDAFIFLREAIKNKEKYDLVILDPAKLAKVTEEIPRALKTYDDLNALALQVVDRGGILLTCSCSGLISEPQFLSVIHSAAIRVHREFQIFKIAGAASDHPVISSFPEGRYLKAVYARIV